MADVLREVLERSRALGFLGPGPVDEQLRHAEAFVGALDLTGVTQAVDLGSGGGVPGLVLASRFRQVHWILLDSMVRRTAFLEDAVATLGLDCEVRTERAETAGRSPLRGTSDLVVARSFGPPATTAECAAPLLRPGGSLVVSEPPGSHGERWPSAGLTTLGLELEAVHEGPPGFVRLRLVREVDERYPRRTGLPAKRPLW